jgi:hypothetical protein
MDFKEFIIEIFLTLGIAAILIFALHGAAAFFNSNKAEAESVTTEVPEYVAKCTKHETTRNTCIEFTLYRITRN